MAEKAVQPQGQIQPKSLSNQYSVTVSMKGDKFPAVIIGDNDKAASVAKVTKPWNNVVVFSITMITMLVLLPLITLTVLTRASSNGFHTGPRPILRASNPATTSSFDPIFGRAGGDMILTEEQKQILMEGTSSTPRLGYNFTSKFIHKWPNNTVPFRWDANFALESKKAIMRAVRRFNGLSCLKFRSRTTEKDYVFFKPGQGCSSYLGRVGPGQGITLQEDGCMQMGIIFHEMMHAVGVFHEQQRYDRDEHVTVHFENIQPEWHSQYQKVKNDGEYSTYNTPYDHYSVMHYPLLAPYKNDTYAMDPKVTSLNRTLIGQRDDVTLLDIQVLNAMYNCSGPILVTGVYFSELNLPGAEAFPGVLTCPSQGTSRIGIWTLIAFSTSACMSFRHYSALFP